MQFSVLTSFPEYFSLNFKEVISLSIFGRAIKDGKVCVELYNFRDYGEGKYKAIDDSPYGGGPGMVLLPEVAEKALQTLAQKNGFSLEELESSVSEYRKNPKLAFSNPKIPLVIYLSPQGDLLTASSGRQFSQYQHIVLLCGHYEGIDERIFESFCHTAISIGDYILTGGELAALVFMDVVARFISGVVGKDASVGQDSFEDFKENFESGLKAPVYTKPKVWRGKTAPEVLLSGHHQKIEKWRYEKSKERTHQWRLNRKKGA